MSCDVIPILTTTQFQTSESTQTSISSSVSTIPGVTSDSFSLTTTCFTASNTSFCSTRTVLVGTVIPPTTTTIDFTITTVVPVMNTIVSTQYSTSCAPGATPVPTPTTTSTTSTSSSSSSSTSSTTSLLSMTTNIGGSTVVVTLPPTSSTSAAPGGSGTHTNLGAIIGGAVGGFVGLIAIALLIWYLIKRNSVNWDDIFEKEETSGMIHPMPQRDPPPGDLKPKPYEYGLVGHVPLAPHMSPPSSTGLSLSSEGPASAYSNVQPVGHHPDASVLQQQVSSGQGQGYNTVGHQAALQQQAGPGQGQGYNTVGHQAAPQQAGPGQGQSYNTVGHQAAPQQAGPGQGQGYNTVGHQPALQQQVGPSQGQGYSNVGHQPAFQQQVGLGQGQGYNAYPNVHSASIGHQPNASAFQQVGPGQGQGYGPSTGSGATGQGVANVGPPASNAIQGVGPAPAGPSPPVSVPAPSVPPIVPIPIPRPVSGGNRYPPGPQQDLNRQGQGGPQRRPPTPEEATDVFGVIAEPVAGPSGNASTTSHGRSTLPSLTASTVTGHGTATSGPSTSEFDPYQEQQQALRPQSRERRDGKGRLVTTGEKRPIVHLDGGRYRLPGSSPSAEPTFAPPAYSD